MATSAEGGHRSTACRPPSIPDITRFAIAFVGMVLTFILFVGSWGAIGWYLGQREVTTFIHEHQYLVADRLKNPSVHAFSLTHATESADHLLIRVDVEDKATYEMLESDLQASEDLRSPPRWETTIRSREELPNNWGYGAWGIALVQEAAIRAGIAAVLALLAFVALAWWGP